jgi:hypothetical protein
MDDGKAIRMPETDPGGREPKIHTTPFIKRRLFYINRAI